MFNRYGVPPVPSTLPVYQPTPSHPVEDHLSVINEAQANSPSSSSIERQISNLDFSLIDVSTDKIKYALDHPEVLDY